MSGAPHRTNSRFPYWFRFSLILVSLGGFTSAFVLVVLPRRFILQSDLVESGVSFPVKELPFQSPKPRPVIQPPAWLPDQPPAPGPAETLWNEILPLMRAGRFASALPLLEDYLGRFPQDYDVWHEYAVALARAGRPSQAEAVYRRLMDARGDVESKLDLARLLRDQDKYADAMALYRTILLERPDDLELRYEFARVLVWAEQYDEAASVYRTLLAQEDTPTLQLELAQVLYWRGDLQQAHDLLENFPAQAAEWPAADSLRSHLAELLFVSEPEQETLLQRAWRAIEARDLVLAERLLRQALDEDPTNAELWMEWTNFHQYQTGDLERARLGLIRVDDQRELTTEERVRLAQLHTWTHHETEAKAALRGLLVDDPDNVAAWALLGDLYLWERARFDAADAYRRALALDPQYQQALEGLETVHQQTGDLIAAREQPRYGLEFLSFQDSDDFSRLDVAAHAAFLWYATAVTARGGYRRVEGVQLGGTPGAEQGPFFELELARWWRLGSVRTAVTAGVEQLDAFGAEPTVAARLEIPDASGTAVQASFEHGPGFRQTITLESVQGIVRSDHLQVAAYRPLSPRWSVAGSGAVASLRTGSASNWRLNGAVTVRRHLTSVVSAALASQFVSFTADAPNLQGRRLYWDPIAFWSNGVQFEARTRSAAPWSWHARLTPAVALVNERATTDLSFIPQLGSEAGVGYESERILFGADAFYGRGRGGDYHSYGLNLRLSVRH